MLSAFDVHESQREALAQFDKTAGALGRHLKTHTETLTAALETLQQSDILLVNQIINEINS